MGDFFRGTGFFKAMAVKANSCVGIFFFFKLAFDATIYYLTVNSSSAVGLFLALNNCEMTFLCRENYCMVSLAKQIHTFLKLPKSSNLQTNNSRLLVLCVKISNLSLQLFQQNVTSSSWNHYLIETHTKSNHINNVGCQFTYVCYVICFR